MKVSHNMSKAQFTRKVREYLFIKAKGLEQEMRIHPENQRFYRSLLKETIDAYKKSGKDPDAGFKNLFDAYMRKYENGIKVLYL